MCRAENDNKRVVQHIPVHQHPLPSISQPTRTHTSHHERRQQEVLDDDGCDVASKHRRRLVDGNEEGQLGPNQHQAQMHQHNLGLRAQVLCNNA